MVTYPEVVFNAWSTRDLLESINEEGEEAYPLLSKLSESELHQVILAMKKDGQLPTDTYDFETWFKYTPMVFYKE
jgi:hypothetical protein